MDGGVYRAGGAPLRLTAAQAIRPQGRRAPRRPVLLFAFRAETNLSQPILIALIAVPILIQSYAIFAAGYLAAWAWRVPHVIAAPCALIGTSNFFELAVAVAIGLFGLGSGAAPATAVGVLVEVPVMLSLVALANRTRDRFPAEAE